MAALKHWPDYATIQKISAYRNCSGRSKRMVVASILMDAQKKAAKAEAIAVAEKRKSPPSTLQEESAQKRLSVPTTGEQPITCSRKAHHDNVDPLCRSVQQNSKIFVPIEHPAEITAVDVRGTEGDIVSKHSVQTRDQLSSVVIIADKRGGGTPDQLQRVVKIEEEQGGGTPDQLKRVVKIEEKQGGETQDYLKNVSKIDGKNGDEFPVEYSPGIVDVAKGFADSKGTSLLQLGKHLVVCEQKSTSEKGELKDVACSNSAFPESEHLSPGLVTRCTRDDGPYVTEDPIADILLEISNSCKKSISSVSPKGNHRSSSWSVPASPETRFTGLINIGNNCYMNSIVQVLGHLESFAQARQWRRDLEDYQSSVYGFVIGALQDMQSSAGQPVSLKHLKSFWEQKLPFFAGNEQHDAQEFFSLLIDCLKEERISYERDIPLDLQCTDSRLTGLRLISSIFSFFLKTERICEICGGASFSQEEFNTLSLPLPKPANSYSIDEDDEVVTLQSLMHRYVRKHTVECTCDVCGAKVKRAQTKFLNSPEVLVLHVSRAQSFAMDESQRRKSKILVDFEKYLNLGDWCWGEQPEYKLHAVVSHVGVHQDCGHYIANIYNHSHHVWHRCDDDTTEVVPGSDAFYNRLHSEVYMLFYVKEKKR